MEKEKVAEIVRTEVVAELYGKVIRRGNYYLADCPNPDCHKRKKSLYIYPKGHAKCYKCGWYAHDSVHYYAKRNRINQNVASEELKKIFNVTEGMEGRIKLKSPEIKEKKKAAPEILDKIYSYFCNSSDLIGEPRLNKEDYEYLKGRGLPDIVIEKNGYRSMPSRAVMEKFVELLKKEGLDEYLRYTPGFFYREAFNDWSFYYINAILIPMKNEFDQIIGLQLRRRVLLREEDTRYCWFSSPYLDEKIPNYKGYLDGLTSGTPLSICKAYTVIQDEDGTEKIVLKNKVKFMAITEGHFKANILALNGVNTITVQGVNSFKAEDIINCIENLSKLQNIGYRDICIFFDADMAYNPNVIKATKVVSEGLINKYNVYVAQWNVEDGKGIDDFIEAGHTLHDVKFIKFYVFAEIADKFLEVVKRNSVKDKDEMKNIYLKIIASYNFD